MSEKVLPDYQQRVVDEKNELDEKFAKLCAFHGTDMFNTLSQEEQDLLRKQADVMAEYTCILGDRIAMFK